MKTLQQTLTEEFGRNIIRRTELPDYLSLGLSRQLRPYQVECFRYLLTYLDNTFEGKARRPHLLFHMATGSGKTLIMAGAMLHLYAMGYRNFLFFVDSTNIVEKTRDNFLNQASAKYLFAPRVAVEGRQVTVQQVENFQGAGRESLNLCLTTIQALHTRMNTARENGLTLDDFSDQPVVFISDEAHHLNAATRRGQAMPSLFGDEEYADEHTRDWETTVTRIFTHDNGVLPNVLLEFTATAELDNEAVAHKYSDKIIYDYPLRRFREDLYSKEVEVVESDLTATDRALQAIIVSQYKRKLFASIGHDVKPVVLFKSKDIKHSKSFKTDFAAMLATLHTETVERLRVTAREVVSSAFAYFDREGVTTENLILELQEDFAPERLLLIDSKNIDPEKQQLLNSLEEPSNGIRAIFAVDMLNEGWDVLNLFDIVRLSETRSVVKGRPGRNTVQEAQLIGRGARYLPFAIAGCDQLEAARRKFDNDADNPLRAIETLHYHSANNPRYIQELHTALVESGIVAECTVQRRVRMKQEVRTSRLVERGVVFVNQRTPLAQSDPTTLGEALRGHSIAVAMPTGKMKTGLLFGQQADTDVLTSVTVTTTFGELGQAVVRTALHRFETFHFDVLHTLYPQLTSIDEFQSSAEYLRAAVIKVTGNQNSIAAYSPADRLYIATSALRQVEPLLVKRGKSWRGTKRFMPKPVDRAFRKEMTLNFTLTSGERELGVSMRESARADLRADVAALRWYAYDDCYGTAEEKALVKYIEGVMPQLEQRYDEVTLVRNERDVRLYSFDTGQAFEPDFVLFLRRRGSEGKCDNLQIFIEPKGGHLRQQDRWKEEFLALIGPMSEAAIELRGDDFSIIGLPFFTEGENEGFVQAFGRTALV
ncbi:MAG: DEAD/DEAH box helicase family protein [Muribaculaceae bacterium]|nr:DEAD/DEAH box helicase family protein [Muribaculaceae bacterium]